MVAHNLVVSVGIYHRLLAMFPMLQVMFLTLLAVLVFFIVDHPWAWLVCSQLLYFLRQLYESKIKDISEFLCV